MTAPRPDGSKAALAMRKALAEVRDYHARENLWEDVPAEVVPAPARSSSVCALYIQKLVLPSTSTPLRICSTATAAATAAT